MGQTLPGLVEAHAGTLCCVAPDGRSRCCDGDPIRPPAEDPAEPQTFVDGPVNPRQFWQESERESMKVPGSSNGVPSRPFSDDPSTLTANGAAYLVFREEEHGQLLIRWSTSPVTAAWASLTPGRPVPLHKFSTHDGEEPLVKPANLGVHKSRLFDGWCMFLKKAALFDAEVVIARDAPVLVTLLLPPSHVVVVSPEQKFAASEVLAVAVGGADSTVFKGVKSLGTEEFVAHAGKSCSVLVLSKE